MPKEENHDLRSVKSLVRSCKMIINACACSTLHRYNVHVHCTLYTYACCTFSSDDRFIMKQIKSVEISSFEQIAPLYFEHVISALESKVSATACTLYVCTCVIMIVKRQREKNTGAGCLICTSTNSSYWKIHHSLHWNCRYMYIFMCVSVGVCFSPTLTASSSAGQDSWSLQHRVSQHAHRQL